MENSNNKKTPLRHGEPWKDEEDNTLNEAYKNGASIPDLMKAHSRSRASIKSRLRKNGLIDDETNKAKDPVDKTKANTQRSKTDLPINNLSPIPDKGESESWSTHTPGIEELDPQSLFEAGFLSPRVKNGLIKMGVQDIRITFDMTASQLMRTSNFGRKSYNELKDFRDKNFTKIEHPNGARALQGPSLQARINDADAALGRISRDAAPIGVELGEHVNLNQLNTHIRKLRNDLRIIERIVHKYEHGFDTLGPRQKTWTANTETAQLLISHLDTIISTAVSNERNGFILKARLGLAQGYLPQTLEQIGGFYNVTRERVRQLQNDSNSSVTRYIYATNTKDSSEFSEICKSLFHNIGTNPENEIIKFVQQHYGNALSQVDVASFFYIGAGLSHNFDKIRKILQGKFTDYRKAVSQEKKQNYLDAKALKKWANIFQYCLYPPQPSKFEGIVTGFDQTLRTPNLKSTFFSEKCQRDIFYESGEEYNIFQILENSPKIIWYREQPIAIPYKHLERDHNYYPDIIVLTDEGRGVVIEVKTPSGPPAKSWKQRGTGMVHWQVLSKALAAKAYLHEEGIGYLMVDSNARSLQSLSQHQYNPKIGSKILEAIEQDGHIKYKQYQSIIGTEKFSHNDMYSLIIQNDLAFQVFPFRLSKLPKAQSFAPLI